MIRTALFLIMSVLAAGEPAWVGSTSFAEVPGYPREQWLVGIGQEQLHDVDAATARKRALDGARAGLAQALRARVQATTARTVEETSGATGRFQERFAQNSTISSDIEFDGLHTEVVARSDAVYALAAVERAVMAASYRQRAQAALDEASSKAIAARAFEQAGRLGEAQDAWAQAVAPVTQAAEHLSLLTVLDAQRPTALEESRRALRSEAGTALARLESRPLTTVDDLADILTRRLRSQVATPPPTLVTLPTLRGTRVPSPFGRAVAARLSAAFGRQAWPVVTTPAQGGPARDQAAATGAKAVLLGSIWPQADGSAQVMVEVVALADGARLGSAEARLPPAAIAATGESLEPANAAKALADQQAFAQDEVLAQGLKLELWTSKGDDAQVFTQGEEMKVFVRVDRPCHLRLIYHLATGEQVLLLSDRFLDESKVNRVYELPEVFECAAPFGVETLQANASSEEFKPLVVIQKDGYPVIAEALLQQLAKTRGMKSKKGQVQLAEQRVTITTVATTGR